jgi:hypothetical protein
VKTEDIIDYAKPLMNVERLAKEVHHHALENDLKTAYDTAMRLGAEARILQRMLELMMEKP